jgi:hypothetical protein
VARNRKKREAEKKMMSIEGPQIGRGEEGIR